MGYVYSARDNVLGRAVSFKILPPEAVSDPGRLSRFIQEARVASALNHPHVIAIYEIREAADARRRPDPRLASDALPRDGAGHRRHASGAARYTAAGREADDRALRPGRRRSGCGARGGRTALRVEAQGVHVFG